jgi:hypothetical protein
MARRNSQRDAELTASAVESKKHCQLSNALQGGAVSSSLLSYSLRHQVVKLREVASQWLSSQKEVMKYAMVAYYF